MGDIDPEVQAAWDQMRVGEHEGVVLWDRELDEAKAQPGRVVARIVCSDCPRRVELGVVHDSRHGPLLLATRSEPDFNHLVEDARRSTPKRRVPYVTSGVAILLDRATPGATVTLRCDDHGTREVVLVETLAAANVRRRDGKPQIIPA